MTEDEPAQLPLKARIAGWALAQVMRLIYFTSRKTFTNLATLHRHLDNDQPFILVSWHNRNILACFGYLAHARRGRRFRPLASASRDGSLAAAAMRSLGVECIRGSSSQGGSKALRQMLRAVKHGHDLGITPDGPRGPKYVVQAGVVTTARLTGIPIIPMAYQAQRRKILRSWDSMIVPYPFNRLHFAYGEPIHVGKHADEAELERCRQAVERELMRLVALVETV
ncbi:lysophospholipid acyltransferase family protein [Panacagrimonas sp.]|uniref:lysophospholipid acyltransferase family protein n=1 Tax=Panacagrimonas sp. TaxID=2480088 RepID=UPI003B52FD0A